MLQYVITIPNPAAAISLLPAGVKDIAIQGLILQPDDGATNPMFIGDESVNGTTLYMFRLNAPAGGVPPVPLIIPLPGFSLGLLGQLYVIGTAGEILRVTAIPR
jgi:hypothetical protein